MNSAKSRKIEKAYTQKLVEQFPEETCKAWVIKADEKIAASGAITICSFASTPIDLSHNHFDFRGHLDFCSSRCYVHK